MGQVDQADAARRFFTRLVTAVAVLAGLLVLIAPLCGDGMVMPAAGVGSTIDSIGSAHDQGPMVGVSVSSCDPMVELAASSSHCVSDAVGRSWPPVESPVPGGALLACIGFVIAILAVVLALLPPPMRRADLVQRAAQPPRLLVQPARRPALAELCVLRT